MFANKKLLTTLCPGDAYAHQATHTHSRPLFLRLCMILLLSLVGIGSAWAEEKQLDNTSYSNPQSSTATNTTWEFTDGWIISNSSNKNYGNAGEYLKYSAAEFTITAPSGKTITALKFIGYSNDTGKIASITKVNNADYSGNTFPVKVSSGDQSTSTYEFTGLNSNNIKFTVANAQACLKISVTYEDASQASSACDVTGISYTPTGGEAIQGTMDGNVWSVIIPYGDGGNSGDGNYLISFTTSANANCTYVSSGETKTLSNPVKKSLADAAGSKNSQGFTVTAEDGTTQKIWTITLVRGAAPIVPPVVKSTVVDNETHIAAEEAIVLPTVPTTKNEALTFQSNARYSLALMNYRLNDFYANKTKTGFGVFSTTGGQETAPNPIQKNSTNVLDYVPGLVAKATLEAVDYYRTSNNVDVKPWFYAISNYAVTSSIKPDGIDGKSFDDLNAVKIYSLLNKFAVNSTFDDGGENTNAAVRTAVEDRYAKALNAIRIANRDYSIANNGTSASDGTNKQYGVNNPLAEGGWWHKATYDNEMWCDGQYMGPALFATMINDFQSYTQVASTGTDWDLITKQFDISWNHLWSSSKQLLYHAFSATPSKDSYWATREISTSNNSLINDTQSKTNTAFWGRADGWYFLALIDVLEQMDRAGISHSDANYTNLRGKLNTLAAGIAARADATTGLWYQVLDKTSTSLSGNYLESSASAIFLTAFMKGKRLGLIDTDYTDLFKKGYKSFVETFLVSDGAATPGIKIWGSSRSAGLSDSRKGDNNYYINGEDAVMVAKTEDVTEGKVLGAFIMAATEYERAYLEEPATDDATLTDIRLKEGSLTPAFNKDVHLYTVNTKCDSKWLDESYVTKSDANATVAFSNNSAKGTQTITVTAADGVTTEEYHLVFLAPNNWNEAFTSTNYEAANPVTLMTDEVATIGKANYNTVKINDKVVNQRFVVQENTSWQMRNDLNFYSANGGARNFGVLNCKKNQTITIVDNADQTINNTNAELISTDGHTRIYRVLEQGNVYFNIDRYCKIESVTINDPAKVTFIVTAGEHGSIAITADGNAITSGSEVEVGAKVVVTATPTDGYETVWTKTAGNDGEEGINTYTINSITEATTINVAFEAVSAGVTNDIYTYNVGALTTEDVSASGTVGGTISGSKAGGDATSGYKLDGATKYIKVTLTTPNTLQAGDKIIVKANSTSSSGGVYLSTASTGAKVGTDDANAVVGGTLSAKNTVEDLEYVVTASDLLKGNSTLYIYYNSVSTYVKAVTIQRTTGGGSKSESPLAITGTAYKNAGEGWTPVVGATIALTDIISSQSTGAYSITEGDAATLADGVLTAVKNGTITLTQAADETFKAGSVDINVRIADNYTNGELTSVEVQEGWTVSDNATVRIKGITMTYGNDNFWSKGSGNDGHGNMTGGQKNPAVTNNIPTSGTFYKFEPTKNGTLTIDTKIGAGKPIYVSEEGTLIAATANGQTVGNGETLDGNYSGNLVFDVKAGKTYYYYLMGSKAGLYGFSFADAVTITTQPVQPEAYIQNTTATALTVAATPSSSAGILSYQWYSCDAEGNNASAVSGATEATYTPATTSVGTTYYYCTISEADGKSVNSDIISVAVSKAFTAPVFTPADGSTVVLGTPISVTWENGMTLYARWSGSDSQPWTAADFSEQHKIGSTGSGNLTRSQTGDQYVYCVLVDEATGASSEVYKTHYVINQSAPAIETQPTSKIVLLNEATTLEVVGGNGANSYQWYECDADGNNGQQISGATQSSYTPNTTAIGTKYYFCFAINSKFDDNPEGVRNFAKSAVASVEVKNTVGTTDTDFLGDIKGNKILYPGQSVNYKFLNNNGAASENYKNFVVMLEGANDKATDDKLYLRADKCGYYWNGTQQYPQDGFSFKEGNADITWDSFNTEMNGASVDLTVSYSPEKVVTVTANIVTSTGKVWTYTYDSQTGGFTYTADAITAALSVDHALLTMQDNASDLNVQASATVLQNHQIVVPYTTSSNGDVVVTHNGNDQKITSFSVNTETKEITIDAGTATGVVGFKIWQKEGSKTTALLDESGNTTGESETQTYLAGVKEFAVTIATDEGAADVSLATLAVNGQAIEVVADQTAYTAKSPSKVIPTVTATATNPSATVTVTQAIAVDGTATIRVATETTNKEYTVKFTPSAETPNGTVHWALSGAAQVNNDYNKVPEYASDADGNIYQMIHKGANGDYYGSFLYLGGETSNVNREISFKGISGKGRVIINTRKSSDSKVGNTIVIKDASGNAVATGTYTNETACATTIFTYDANQTYTANINGRAYILSMDYVPCREDILYVEENGQRYNLTKENEANDDYYIGKNESWSEIKIDGTKYNLFNLNGNSRSFTLNVNGAMAFEILTQNNSSSNRTYKISVDGNEVTNSPFTANKNSLTSTGLIMTGNTGDITITVSNGSGSVYPYQIIFYDKEPEASLSSNSALVKVDKTLQVPLSTMSGGAITLTNAGTDIAKATASFNADSKVLTLKGLAEGTSTLTFNVEGGNGYVASTVEFTVNVEKQVLTLSYSPASYSYNVDTEEESGNLTPTLIVKDEDDNDVSLSGLNITYTSDDESIATVTSDGTITKRATGQGSADIVATLVEDGTYKASYGVFSVIIEQGVSLKITEDYKFADDKTSPAVGETLTLKSADGTTDLLYATFGGWKWGLNGDNNDHKYDLNGSTKSDGWGVPGKYTGSGGTRPTYVDGYSFASSGKTDAMDETKNPSDGAIFGKTRNGWFKSESNDPHVKPFTLPVRGAYMTFEPQQNGMLSVYILQNGAFNSSTQSDGTSKIIPGEFQPHSFHVVDYNGVAVPLYTDFKFVVKEPVTQKVNGNSVVCNYTDNMSQPAEFVDNDVATWPMFYTNYTEKERQDIRDAWSSGKNGAQKVVKLHDESFFITQKAYVKYTFYVAASQTYYLFSNFSKIGFAGMNFIPDADQPDESDLLALKDNEAFPKLKNASENVSSNLSVPQYGKITVNRSFTAGNWNTICLPFDMTEREVIENFGEGTVLQCFDGTEQNQHNSTLHFVYHEIQSILAGYPYLIKPTKNVTGITVKNKLIQPANSGTPSEPVLDYTQPKGFVDFSTSRYWTNTPYVAETIGDYTFRGTIGATTPYKKGDLYMSTANGGTWKRMTAESGNLKGYRAFIQSNSADNYAKSLYFVIGNFDTDTDIPTAIYEVEIDENSEDGINLTPVEGVFNLSGQKVSNDIRNLPKGIYIVNGKKFYVK